MPKKDGTPTRGELRVKKGRLKPEKLAERQAKQIDRSPDAVKHALITEALKTKLPEHANEIADNLIKMAKSRDHQAAIPATKIILERTDGPVKQQLEGEFKREHPKCANLFFCSSSDGSLARYYHQGARLKCGTLRAACF